MGLANFGLLALTIFPLNSTTWLLPCGKLQKIDIVSSRTGLAFSQEFSVKPLSGMTIGFGNYQREALGSMSENSEAIASAVK